MLTRILEPELMDTAEDASEYDAMDHSAVNTQFVTDLLAALTDWSLKRPVQRELAPLKILDLGAGTAQIPIELARRAATLHITAVDAAESMLALARRNVAAAGLADRIELVLADAKNLPFEHVGWAPPAIDRRDEIEWAPPAIDWRDEMVGNAHPTWSQPFPVVISNSILHHIAEPRRVIAEALRVTAPGGLLFHRDLARPQDEIALEHLVATYAADTTHYQRNLFAQSLHAALTIEEICALVAAFGFAPDTVQMSSDRHWTWIASKPAASS